MNTFSNKLMDMFLPVVLYTILILTVYGIYTIGWAPEVFQGYYLQTYGFGNDVSIWTKIKNAEDKQYFSHTNQEVVMKEWNNLVERELTVDQVQKNGK